MPDMHNIIWLMDGDGHLHQKHSETDEQYVERQREYDRREAAIKKFNFITKTAWRTIQ